MFTLCRSLFMQLVIYRHYSDTIVNVMGHALALNMPRQSSRALYGAGEAEADRENDGKMTSGIGQVWN